MRTSNRSGRIVANTLLVFSFFLINATAFSQDTLKAGKPLDLGAPHDFSLKNKWYYFNLADTISVTVIDQLPVPASFGLISGSMTIAETRRGDIIRIIDQANGSSGYRKGQMIKVAPANRPSSGSTGTLIVPESPVAKKTGSSSFDLAVQKTTWGRLLAN